MKTSNSKTYESIDLAYDRDANLTSRMQELWKAGASDPTVAGDVGTGSWTYGYDGAVRMTSANGTRRHRQLPGGGPTATTGWAIVPRCLWEA
ncbi:MAG: hypothetical protein ABI635_04770 [Actinomycetota bacterium]